MTSGKSMKTRDLTVISLATIVWCLLMQPCYTIDLNFCTSALGMESGSIPDSSITASSTYASLLSPEYGRLNLEILGGAWCPKPQIEPGVKEFIEVDLITPHLITAVATQGRHQNGKGQEYMEEYIIEYWRPEMSEFRQYSRWDDKIMFRGNSDTNTAVQHRLTPPVHATKIRIIPHSLMIRTVCLRFELYGCVDESGVITYSIPEPSNEKGEHVDKKYDGWKDFAGNMNGGLGGLTDGQVGGDFFSLDMGYAKGNGWTAWKNSSFPNGYMELTFEFDRQKNVTQADIYTNNYFSRDVQLFSTAVIFFSIGGRYYNGEPVIHFEKEDKISQRARNVTINIQGGRIAKFIRIRLYFNSEWIMISEVYFHAVTTNKNVSVETEQKSFENLLENSIYMSDADRRLTASKSTNIIVILLIVLISVILLIIIPIFFIKKNNKYSSQSTASILRNTFNFNLKDLFLNLTPPINEASDVRLESPRTARMSQGRRTAAAEESTDGACPKTPSGFILNKVHNNSLSINSVHVPSYDSGNISRSASRGLPLGLDCGFMVGYGHDYIHDIDPDSTQDELFSNYDFNFGPEQIPSYSFGLGINYDRDRNLSHGSGRPTLVTAVSPESHRGRAVVTLAPNKCAFNPKNLPNILQDGIHVDCLNAYDDGRDDLYRFQASNSRDNYNPEIPLQRFLTLGAPKHKISDIEDDNDPHTSVFASNTHARERLGKANKFDNRMERKDRTFSLSDLKKIHARNPGNVKDVGAITIWNISPAFKRSFPEVEIDINAVSMNCLRLILKIGTFGSQEITIYETKKAKNAIANMPKIVQVKTVRMTSKDATFKEYIEELKYLGSMEHPSLSRLVGLVTNQSPPLAVFEYTYSGDLYQHLRKNTLTEQTKLPVLLSIILQICSAMKYLEAREAVHKDLAARNILLFPGNKIKVTDTAMCSPLYTDHYYTQDGAKPLPIRWLSWECTLLKRYTCPGTVWSFAITAWEIFNLCQYFPYEKLAVNDIVKIAEDYLLKKEVKEIHPKPESCPEDLYKIMLNCWERKSKHRPTFKEIYSFLKSKYINLVPINDQF